MKRKIVGIVGGAVVVIAGCASEAEPEDGEPPPVERGKVQPKGCNYWKCINCTNVCGADNYGTACAACVESYCDCDCSVDNCS
jgi:hypothetical protein